MIRFVSRLVAAYFCLACFCLMVTAAPFPVGPSGEATAMGGWAMMASGPRHARVNTARAAGLHLSEATSQTDWRYTQQGWRQLRLVPAIRTHAVRMPAQRPPLVHPFQISMLILLCALGLVAWASDEWDWARFVCDENLPSGG